MEQQKSLPVAMAQNKGDLILEQIRILYTQNNITAKRITSKCQVIIGYDYVIIPKRMNTNNILHLNEAALCDNNCLNEEQNLISYEKNPELFINLHANSVLKDSKEVLNCWKPKYRLNTIEDITKSRSSKKQLQKSNNKVVLPLSSLVNDLKNIPSASQAGLIKGSKSEVGLPNWECPE